MPDLWSPRSTGETLSLFIRAGFSLLAAIAVTFGLFYLMQRMTAPEDMAFEKQIAGYFPMPYQPVIIICGLIPYVTKPEIPGKFIDEYFRQTRPDLRIIENKLYTTLPQLELHGTGFAVLPAKLVASFNPEYPFSARRRKIEGYVLIGYEIDDQGAVVDPYVIDSSDKIFEKNALRAVIKFKYKPKFLDGMPIRQKGLKLKFTFGLENEN
ncbi:energy transducer TonB [Emcibacter sp.]|uniref:energy transducer TonB n=1 Tax=Emcibacter sp. TaxID=1979954 RepID=UPI002AA875BB|nr:energy transducer TonB [Emcibacter sp.]